MVAFGVIRRINENKQRQEYAKKCVHKWFDEYPAPQDQSPTANQVINDKKISEFKDAVFTKQKISHLFPTSRNEENADVKRLQKCVASELRHLEQLEKDLIRKVERKAKEFDGSQEHDTFLQNTLYPFIKAQSEYQEISKYKGTEENPVEKHIFLKYVDKKKSEMQKFLETQISGFLNQKISSDPKAEELLSKDIIDKTIQYFLSRIISTEKDLPLVEFSKTLYTKLIIEWMNIQNKEKNFELFLSIPGLKVKEGRNDRSYLFIEKNELKKFESKIQSRNKEIISEKIGKYVFLQGKFLNSTEDSIVNDLKQFSELDEKGNEILNFNALLNDPVMRDYVKETFRNAKEKRGNFLKNKIKSSLSDAFDSMYIDPLNLNSEFKKAIEFLKSNYEPYLFLEGGNGYKDFEKNDLVKKVHAIFQEHRQGVNLDDGKPKFSNEEFKASLRDVINLGNKEVEEKRQNFLKNDLKEKIKSSLSDAFDSMYIDPLNSEFKKAIEFLKSNYEPYLFLEGENGYKDFEKNDLVKKVHAIFQEHRQGVNLDDGKPKFSDEEFKVSLKDAISLGIQEVEEKREDFLKDKINTCLLTELKSNDFKEFKDAIEFLKEKDTKKGYDFCFYPTDYSDLYKNNAIIKNIHEIFQKLKSTEQNGINPKYTDEEIKAILIKFFKSTWDIKNAFDIINDNKGKSEKEKIELVQKIILPKLRSFLLEKGISSYHAHLITPEEVPAILKMIEKLQSRPEFWKNCQIILSKITQEKNDKGGKKPYDARTIWRFVNEVLSIEDPALLSTVMGKIQNDERTLLDFQVKTSSEKAYLKELKLLRGNSEKYEGLKFSKIVGLYETAEWKKFEALILNFLKENDNAKKIQKPISTPMQVCNNRENNETNANNPNPIGYNVIEPAPGLSDCSRRTLFDEYPHIQEEIFEAQAMLEGSCESMGPRHPLSMIGYLFLSHHAISLLQEARGIVWGIFKRYKDEMMAEITKNSSKIVEYKEFMDEISQKLSINNLWLYAMELAIKRRELAGPKCGDGILETWEKDFLKHIFSHYELENDGTSF